MFGRVRGQPVERRDKAERRRGTRQFPTLYQILGQQQISNRGHNRDEQNSDCRFALVEQSPNESKSAFQIVGRKCVSQLKDYSSTREWDEGADLLCVNAPFRAQIEIDFFQFVFDLT